jgi:hypothetical protein
MVQVKATLTPVYYLREDLLGELVAGGKPYEDARVNITSAVLKIKLESPNGRCPQKLKLLPLNLRMIVLLGVVDEGVVNIGAIGDFLSFWDYKGLLEGLRGVMDHLRVPSGKDYREHQQDWEDHLCQRGQELPSVNDPVFVKKSP